MLRVSAAHADSRARKLDQRLATSKLLLRCALSFELAHEVCLLQALGARNTLLCEDSFEVLDSELVVVLYFSINSRSLGRLETKGTDFSALLLEAASSERQSARSIGLTRV